jgi:hypothetical protein
MSKSWLFVGLAVLLAGESGAQTAPAPEEEERRQPAREIRVLRHPYDISSFYTSSPSPAPAFRGGAFAAPAARDCSEERYPISCYYRSSQQRPWIGYAAPMTPEGAAGEWDAFGPHLSQREPRRGMMLPPILITPWGH